jgi:hypothetical protein
MKLELSDKLYDKLKETLEKYNIKADKLETALELYIEEQTEDAIGQLEDAEQPKWLLKSVIETLEILNKR